MEKVALGKIATVRSGYPFRHRPERATSGGCALVQMRDLDGTAGIVREPLEQVSAPEGWKEHRLGVGDVLFASRGPRNDAAEFIGESDAIPASHLLVLRLKMTADVLPGFLAWFLNRPDTQEQLRSLRVGTGIPFIPTDEVREFRILVPDTESQLRILYLHRLAIEESRLMNAVQAKRQEMLTGVFQTLLTRQVTT